MAANLTYSMWFFQKYNSVLCEYTYNPQYQIPCVHFNFSAHYFTYVQLVTTTMADRRTVAFHFSFFLRPWSAKLSQTSEVDIKPYAAHD